MASPALYSCEYVDFQAELARKSLREFIRQAWDVVEPAYPYIHNWHIDAIAEHLEAVTRGQIRKLLINIPPGHAKSLLVSVLWPAWVWTQKPGKPGGPKWRSLFASYGADLSLRDSVKCRDLIESKWFQETFKPTWRLSKAQNAKGNFMNSEKGFRLATSVGGRGTGFRGEAVVCDDPLRAQDAHSPKAREEVIRWWDHTMSSRLNDKRSGSMVIIMQRLHECLLPQSGIITPMGVIPVKDIKLGDEVLTSLGSQRVTAIAKRSFAGTAVGIRTYGFPQTFWVTPEHPVLTIGGWKQAGSITARDILVSPIPSGETTAEELLQLWPDMPPRTAPKPVHSVTGKRAKIPREELERLLDQGKTSAQIAEHFGRKNRQLIDDYIAAYGIVRHVAKELPKEILLDEAFWRVVGYWLAEGNLLLTRRGEPGTVRFIFGEQEQGYIEDITATMETHGISPSVTPAPSTQLVTFGSSQCARFFSLFGSLQPSRRLPEWAVTLPPRFLQQLIIGYWRGDGSDNDQDEIRFGSCSLDLLSTLQRAFLHLGIVSSVMTQSSGESTRTIKTGPRTGHVIHGHGQYELRVHACDAPWILPPKGPSPRYRQNVIHKGRALVKIRSIKTKPYEGDVFDIETPCHDFLSGLITAHNCDLSGHVLEKGGYEHLCLPTRFEPERRSVTCLGADPREFPGELLFPKLFPAEVVDEIENRELGPSEFAGQHQQRPSPEGGGILKKFWWKYWQPKGANLSPVTVRLANGDLQEIIPVERPDLDTFDQILSSWDCAFKDLNTSDYVVGQVWAKKGANKYLLDSVRDRMDIVRTMQAIERVSDKWPRALLKLVEDKANGTAVIQLLRNKVAGLVAVEPEGGKINRAWAVTPQIESGNVYLPHPSIAPWVESLIEECAAFPNGAHDDQVDSLTQALNRLGNKPTPRVRLTSEPWEDD